MGLACCCCIAIIRHDIKAWGLWSYSALSIYTLHYTIWTQLPTLHTQSGDVRCSKPSQRDNTHIQTRRVLLHPPCTLPIGMFNPALTQSSLLVPAAGTRRGNGTSRCPSPKLISQRRKGRTNDCPGVASCGCKNSVKRISGTPAGEDITIGRTMKTTGADWPFQLVPAMHVVRT